MGFFRLVLSLLVVGSHFGNVGEPVGGTAVSSFFAISGFLMARTITENYPGWSGVMRFYANRFVRIVPPFLVVLLLTALALWARESRPFQITLAGEMMMPDTNFPPVWWKTLILRRDSYPTFLFARVFLAPQTWSLVVEGVFYLLVPLLVFLTRRRTIVSLWIAAAGSLALAVICATSPSGNIWLRSPISSLWVFILGLLAYVHAPRLDRASWHRWRWLAFVPIVGVVAIGLRYVIIPERSALFVAPVLTVTWLVLGRWSVRRSGSLDRMLGNLAYGVFVGHFLSSFLMLWIADAVYQTTGVFGIFGMHGVTERIWRNNFYVFALLGGAAIYYGLERPLERVRSRLRQRRPSAAASIAV